MSRFATFMLLGCATVLLVGCGSAPGYPKRVITAQVIDQATKDFDKDPTVQNRNVVLNGLIARVDLSYNAFEQELTGGRAVMNTASTLVNIGLTSAATIVDSGATKTILSAIATGLTGAKATVDKELFYDQTSVALSGTMRAARLEALTKLETGMLTPDLTYSLAKGLRDIVDYENSGTILSAIHAINEEAGTKAARARAAIFRARGL